MNKRNVYNVCDNRWSGEGYTVFAANDQLELDLQCMHKNWWTGLQYTAIDKQEKDVQCMQQLMNCITINSVYSNWWTGEDAATDELYYNKHVTAVFSN